MPTWETISSEQDITEAINASHASPVVIFKHSTTCPISSIAKMRVEDGMSDWANAKWYYLDLLRHRNLSNHIADHLQVHHQSPQAIVLNAGEVVYDVSHLDISVADLKSAVPA